MKYLSSALVIGSLLAFSGCDRLKRMISSEILIDSQISLSKEGVQDPDNVSIIFKITNRSDKKIQILVWNTPFEPISNNIFEVKNIGSQVLYKGKMTKRGEPLVESYLTLLPGESIQKLLNLSEFYDLSKVGTYSVKFRDVLHDISLKEIPRKRDEFQSYMLQSNVLTFNIEKAGTPFSPGKQSKFFSAKGNIKVGDYPVPNFANNCNLQQKNLTLAALRIAFIMGNLSKTEADTHSRDSVGNAYGQWFIFPTDPHTHEDLYDFVKGHMDSIQSTIANQTLSIDCSGNNCNPGDYAWVDPNSPYNINLCAGFFADSSRQYDSPGGVLIHEISHFNVVAGTGDFAYGVSKAMNLAETNPSQAARNGDNHEYYAEGLCWINSCQ